MATTGNLNWISVDGTGDWLTPLEPSFDEWKIKWDYLASKTEEDGWDAPQNILKELK